MRSRWRRYRAGSGVPVRHEPLSPRHRGLRQPDREARDALLGAGGKTFDVVLTNPPFGKKQSCRIVRDDGEIDTERED